MSLSKSKCWYSNNCLHFLKCAVPLKTSQQMFKVANGGGTVVEHSPHHSKVEGLSPGDRKTKWQKEPFLVNFLQLVRIRDRRTFKFIQCKFMEYVERNFA